MQEIYHNIFQETISYSDRHMSPRNLYLIRQPGRSLMVDTSFRFERDWEILRSMVETLGVSYKDLDVFITHDHPDHTGLVPALQELGASVFMNPEETRKRADLLHCYLADEASRIQNLRIVGVTKRIRRRSIRLLWNIPAALMRNVEKPRISALSRSIPARPWIMGSMYSMSFL